MQTLRLTHSTQSFFSDAWALYEHSFPREERRSMESQLKIMANDNYRFEVIVNNGAFLCLLCWWGFDDLRYLDHFATMPELRGQGLGNKILKEFMDSDERPVLLEVELPKDDLSKRRINFYLRLGFILNESIYNPPSYNPGEPPPDLHLMSYPSPILDSELHRFENEHHLHIYPSEM